MLLFQKRKVHYDVTLNFEILSMATLISGKRLINQLSHLTVKGTEKSCQILNTGKQRYLVNSNLQVELRYLN